MTLDHVDTLRVTLGPSWCLTARPDGTVVAYGPRRLHLTARPSGWLLRQLEHADDTSSGWLASGTGLPTAKAIAAAVCVARVAA
jgi:hypothetical protein